MHQFLFGGFEVHRHHKALNELGYFGPDKVRVNCVNPVFSPDTALSAEFAGGAITDEARKAFLATIPLGRFSTPLDVANACLYLASDEAAMISGTCIEVDGARCV